LQDWPSLAREDHLFLPFYTWDQVFATYSDLGHALWAFFTRSGHRSLLLTPPVRQSTPLPTRLRELNRTETSSVCPPQSKESRLAVAGCLSLFQGLAVPVGLLHS